MGPTRPQILALLFSLAVEISPSGARARSNCGLYSLRQQYSAFLQTPSIRACRTGARRPWVSQEWVTVQPSNRELIQRRTSFVSETCGEEDSDEEGEDDGWISTQQLLDDPSIMESWLASITRPEPPVPPFEGIFRPAMLHHCGIRTRDIVRAITFYSLLGMKEVARFKADSARCAMLEGAGMRLELIEVPMSMSPPDKAVDLSEDMRALGLNHIAFDVGPAMEEKGLENLKEFLLALNKESEDLFDKSVRLAISPFEQRIGQEVFDLAFIMDPDGALVELLHRTELIEAEMPPSW